MSTESQVLDKQMKGYLLSLKPATKSYNIDTILGKPLTVLILKPVSPLLSRSFNSSFSFLKYSLYFGVQSYEMLI